MRAITLDLFNVVTGVMQGDKFVPFIFIICQKYILPPSKIK